MPFVSSILGSLLVSSSAGAVVPASPAPAMTTSATSAGSTDDLAEGAATARARYNEGDFAGALAAADDVDASFRAGAAFTTDEAAWMVWADARVTRALALRRLGRDADADASLVDVAIVRPSYAPDRGFVPPKTVARFEELRDVLIGGPTAPLTIVVHGGGGVVLDGRARGPGTVDTLPGTHFIGVTGGPAPKGEVVVVTGPRTVKLGGTTAAPGAAVALDRHNAAPATTVDDGPPWLWLGLGGGALAIASAAVVVVAIVTGRGEPPGNPGGVTFSVDSSELDAP